MGFVRARKYLQISSLREVKRSLSILLVLLISACGRNDPPRVLLIGDSISMEYTPLVVNALQDEAFVLHHKGNAEYSGRGVKMLDYWLGKGKWDVIHFNFGLWDMYGWKYIDTLRTPETYAENLEIIVKKLKRTRAHLIWATTTPVCPEPEKDCNVLIDPEEQHAFRDAALSVMNRHGIQVNDLFETIAPHRDQYALGDDNVHYTREGYELLAGQVVESIRSGLSIRARQ